MGTAHAPLPVKLFVGMLSAKTDLFAACAETLSAHYGPIEYESPVVPWNVTDYYRDELGEDVKRKFLFFERLADPGLLPAIKHYTNSLEHSFRSPETGLFRRRVNLDPGYITEAKVVLATTKDFSHRMYIGDNIYAEVTLRYHAKDRSFLPHEYTFPEFRTPAYLDMFNRMRESLRCALAKS